MSYLRSARDDITYCQSPGCQEEVAVRQVQTPNGAVNRQRSQWCLKHTCTHFFRPEACPLKKFAHDSVCAEHVRCTITGCELGRVQYSDPKNNPAANGPKYLRTEYCPQHQCTEKGCPQRRKQGPNGDFLLVCEAHKCRNELCTERRQDELEFCKKHKCEVADCFDVAHKKEKLCREHLYCEDKSDGKSCNGDKHLDPTKKTYLEYCLIHAKCKTPNCDKYRAQKSSHCVKHTCIDRGCDKSSGASRCCEDHRCMFVSAKTQMTCNHVRAWISVEKRSSFCPAHMCRKIKCESSCDDMEFFCAKHKCGTPGCTGEMVSEGLCSPHLKIKHRDEMMRALQPLIDDMMHRLSDKDKAVTSWKMAQGAGGGVVVGSAADPAGWVSVPHPPKH